MARLKGGKYLINLGVLENNTNYVDRFPKELITYIQEHTDSEGFFDYELNEKLKPFEISFVDENGYKLKIVPILKIGDDSSSIVLSGNEITKDDNLLYIDTYHFIIYYDDGVLVIYYTHDSVQISLE